MKNNQINIKEILDGIYLSIQTHYKNNNEDVDKLIKNDVNNSIKNQSNDLIFKRLVYSIHNTNWNAISQETFWEKNFKNYEKAFKNFDVKYSSKLKLNQLKNKGLINSDKKLQYCINAAKFIAEIEYISKSDVLTYFNKFAYNGSSVYERWALINLISQSVNGIGTALACDFLKETGFLNYGKPDVHIKRIFERIGVIDYFKEMTVYSNKDFFIFRILDIFAQKSNKSLFEIDKILWFFATGFNNSTGKAIGGICKDKPECIDYCKINNYCKYFSSAHNTK